jgi:hypothetical protein
MEPLQGAEMRVRGSHVLGDKTIFPIQQSPSGSGKRPLSPCASPSSLLLCAVSGTRAAPSWRNLDAGSSDVGPATLAEESSRVADETITCSLPLSRGFLKRRFSACWRELKAGQGCHGSTQRSGKHRYRSQNWASCDRACAVAAASAPAKLERKAHILNYLVGLRL